MKAKVMTREELREELHADAIRRGKRRGGCPDRMCGADDCPNCHPEGEADNDETRAE